MSDTKHTTDQVVADMVKHKPKCGVFNNAPCDCQTKDEDK